MNLSILTLPGTSSFIDGHYGLQECVVRGITRINLLKPSLIYKLQITLKGIMESAFWDIEFDKHPRKSILVQEHRELLSHVNLPAGMVDIPFEIAFPAHEKIGHGFGACTQLLPSSIDINGSANGWKYSGRVKYQLVADISTQSPIPLLNATAKTFVDIEFKPYDPRLIVNMMHPTPRQWKSHIGQIPLEYDIQIDTHTVGRGDNIKLKYKLLLNSTFADIGLRVHKVSVMLKEFHFVGDARCCALDDEDGNWFHGQAHRVMGTVEFPIFEQLEYQSTKTKQVYPNHVIIINSCLESMMNYK